LGCRSRGGEAVHIRESEMAIFSHVITNVIFVIRGRRRSFRRTAATTYFLACMENQAVWLVRSPWVCQNTSLTGAFISPPARLYSLGTRKLSVRVASHSKYALKNAYFDRFVSIRQSYECGVIPSLARICCREYRVTTWTCRTATGPCQHPADGDWVLIYSFSLCLNLLSPS
jgi:hypothetical protein